MAIKIHNQVYNNIRKFYINVRKKYPNTNSYEDVLDQINKVYNEVYKVGSKPKLNPNTSFIPNEWDEYNVHKADNSKWNFAYKEEDGVINVYDARHSSGMANNTHFSQSQSNDNHQPQQNVHQKQIGYKSLSKECYGLTMVKSNSGLFNYVDKTGTIIYPNQWFTNAGDFIERDGVVYSNVEVDGIRKVLVVIPTYKLMDINESVEKTIKSFLVEQSCEKILNLMDRVMKV